MDIDKSKISFSFFAKELDSDELGIAEVYIFKIKYLSEEIGIMKVRKFIDFNKDNNLYCNFYDIDLRKFIPYVFWVNITDNFRGHEIAVDFYQFVNNYCMENFKISLHSGFNPSSSAINVWKKLIKKKLAVFLNKENYPKFKFI